MKSTKDSDNILDKVTSDIRNEQVDAAIVDRAADRVWARISAEALPTATLKSATVDRIESCADFQSLIPAYLNRELSEARSLLLVDHTHECIPCRRAMNNARTASAPRPAAAPARRYILQPVILRWGVAAALVIGLGLVALPLIQRYLPFGDALDMTVQAAEGQVYRVGEANNELVTVGQKLARGERIRTAKDGHAFVKLGDGSVIEVKDRSEFYVNQNGQGTTIHLNRGSIVVEAAKQRNQRLFVETSDSLVSVTGTVFSVNSGTKGSRVSVIEGEVRFDHNNNERVLRAGEQATSTRAIEAVPVKDEVAWSKNATRYAQTLHALVSLKNELNRVARPGLRNSTHLLDLMPEETVVYAALPNLTQTLTESHRIMEQRINQNAALRDWWEKRGPERGPRTTQVMQIVKEFGDYLGEEIAISVSMDQQGEPAAPLVLAELKNSSGFKSFLEQQIAKFAGNEPKRSQIIFVDDPANAAQASNEAIYIWIKGDLFAASPKLNQLQSVAQLATQGGTSGFTATPFHNRIAQIYQEGAGLVVAANLERVIAQTKEQRAKGGDGAKKEEALQKLGVLSLKYFVLDQKETAGKTHTEASLTFSESQRGIPSWLAAPGPMGSLEYISPDANIVAGFVVKQPSALVDDLLGVVETVSPDLRKNLDQLQATHGLDVRRDIAEPLGGEFAFAIDGPLLPTPSWKMVFEVNDPEHLQQALEKVVGEVNKQAARLGKAGLVWDRGEISSRPYYTLRSADFGVEVNYTFVNGYMIVGPSRALVERSVRTQESGYTLLRSSKFTAGLPADGNANFSAIFYHNLGSLVQPFAERIANSATSLPQEQQQAIKAIAAEMPPTLAYAYAKGDSITFAANTDGGPFGLSPATLLGMPNALEIQHILQQGMGNRK